MDNFYLKKINILWALALIFILVAIPAFSGCNNDMAKEDSDITAILTILPQVEFISRITGDDFETVVMIPPGASPHTYEPKPSQLEKVSEAEIYVMIGSGVEFELAWSDKIIAMNEDMLVIDCSEDVRLLKNIEDGNTDNPDPHIWLSLKNVKIMTENIYDGISKIDPENQEKYLLNLEKYHADLDDLDVKIRDIFEDQEIRKIMVQHGSWAYFAEDYGLEQVPIEVGGKEPTPRGIESIIDQAKKDNIKVVFASPEFSTKSAETIAKEIGGTVVLVSPLEKDYLKNMEKIANSFAKAME